MILFKNRGPPLADPLTNYPLILTSNKIKVNNMLYNVGTDSDGAWIHFILYLCHKQPI